MIKKNNIKASRYLYMVLLLLALVPTVSWSQNLTVSGVVLDNTNQPLVGATVNIKNTTKSTVTDINGSYSITDVSAETILVFKYTGFVTKEEKVGNRLSINIELTEDKQVLNEVVVVGYGKQQKISLTGAVSSIKGSELRQTKNENPQNMLTGRVAGVRVWQKSAEPGSFNNNMDIRGLGSPLVVIDGVPRTMAEFQRMSSNDIENISVLKDGSAAIYGVRAANGVLLVTTKKGSTDSETKISINSSYTLQRPSGMPKLANAFDTMTLYNERAMNNINGGNVIFTPKDFEDFANGTRKTTDWNSLIISDFSPQHEHDLSISGGGKKTQYYIGSSYLYQEGIFKSGDLNYNKFNIRANIDTEIAKGLKFSLKLSGIADVQNSPYSTSSDIIRNYWRQGVLFPAFADSDNTLLNYQGLDLEENTVAKMTSDISGYRKSTKKYFQSTAEINYDFGTLSNSLKGLSAKALINYDYRFDNNTSFRKEYYQYAYNNLTNTYDSKLYNQSSPSRIRREVFTKDQLLGQFIINYDRTFNETHKVSGLIGLESQKRRGDNFYAQRDLAFSTDYLFAGVAQDQIGGMYVGNNDLYEIANSALIGRVNYAFKNRYISEFQFRHDGTSKFAKGHQWGFFPSVSLGWRLSEEPFFKNISKLSFINQLKVRSSYGVLGDDGSAEFDWATGYIYPATGSNPNNGYYSGYAPGSIFGDKFVFGLSTLALPNQSITWFTSHTFNFGVDFEGWNGLFGFSIDYFNRKREGLFARSNGELPTVIGSTAPRENLDSDQNFGIDLELNHRYQIGDFKYKVKAIATVTRSKHLTASENGPYGNSYEKWRNDNLTNRYQGVQFGYESAGRYENWDDIWSYQIYKDKNILPGDYKYEDWNGDGEINGLDQHPFAFDQTPWVNFSLGLECRYKNFDMNLLLQGSALGSVEYREPLYSIWGSNGGGTLEQYLDRWHPLDPSADPYDPETKWNQGYYGYTGNYPFGNSEFNRVRTDYLRLKSIELGYTFTNKKMNSNTYRLFVNAYNLLTITNVKFVDPEHPDDELGRLYPLNKNVTMGISMSF
ncbi:SusC/RagA family TonB-linked outer membrane protein [Flavobacterium sp. MAHUQ-51]|uniref:SusC/RagA family TonB-linked outer membrane protein n=1 Tax=Flavobacterium sp. GCM10022190 TaxID=3252639 RepID=UPI00361EFF58